MIFKTRKAIFEEFLDMAELEGTLPEGKKGSINESFIIEAKKGALTVRRVDITQAVYVEVVLSKVDITDEGELPIGDIKELRKYLKRMGTKVTIKYDGSTITLTDGPKTAKFQAVNDKISYMRERPYSLDEKGRPFMNDRPFAASFEVMSTELKSISEDANTVKERIFPISVDENLLRVKVGKPQTATIKTELEPIDFQGEPAESLYGFGFDNIVSNVEGLLHIDMMDNGPIIFRTNEKDLNFEGMLAPAEE